MSTTLANPKKKAKSDSSSSSSSSAAQLAAKDNRLIAQRRSVIQREVTDSTSSSSSSSSDAAVEETVDDAVVVEESEVDSSSSSSSSSDSDIEATSEQTEDVSQEEKDKGIIKAATMLKNVAMKGTEAAKNDKDEAEVTESSGYSYWDYVKMGAITVGDMLVRFIPGVGALYGFIKDSNQAKKRYGDWKGYSSSAKEMENDSSGVVSIFQEKVAFAMKKAKRGFINAIYAVFGSGLSLLNYIVGIITAGLGAAITGAISMVNTAIGAIKTLVTLLRGGWKWFSGTLHKDRQEAVRLLVESAAGRGKHADQKEKALEIIGRIDPNFTEEWAIQALDSGGFDKATEALYNSMSSKAE